MFKKLLLLSLLWSSSAWCMEDNMDLGKGEDAKMATVVEGCACKWVDCAGPDGKARVFPNTKELDDHVKSHLTKRLYICRWGVCDKKFSQKDYLASHTRIHTGYGLLRCNSAGCDRVFINRNTLDRHTQIHTGERPYKCKYPGCDKAFICKGGLVSHMQTHTGERSYKCEYPGCDRAFKRKANLGEHSQRHEADHLHKCAQCGKAFASDSDLYHHTRRRHSNKVSRSGGISVPMQMPGLPDDPVYAPDNSVPSDLELSSDS